MLLSSLFLLFDSQYDEIFANFFVFSAYREREMYIYGFLYAKNGEKPLYCVIVKNIKLFLYNLT